MVLPDRVMFTLLGRDFYWYGFCIAAGVFLAVALASRLARGRAVSSDTILDLALVAMPSALVGARLYFVAFQWEYYAADPLRILYVWEGGLAVYGGIIAGVIAGLVFCRVKKINFWVLADIAAPAIALGQAIGRWGNFFNQEAYGTAVTNPAWQFFPFAVYIEGMAAAPEGPWHMAAFFYEFVWCVAVTVFLVWLFRRDKKPGIVILAYAALYGVGRAVIEGLRTDALMWGPVRVSQALSIVLVLVCGTLLLREWLRGRTPRVEADESLRLFKNGRVEEDDADETDTQDATDVTDDRGAASARDGADVTDVTDDTGAQGASDVSDAEDMSGARDGTDITDVTDEESAQRASDVSGAAGAQYETGAADTADARDAREGAPDGQATGGAAADGKEGAKET